jgi:hypothetical protein
MSEPRPIWPTVTVLAMAGILVVLAVLSGRDEEPEAPAANPAVTQPAAERPASSRPATRATATRRPEAPPGETTAEQDAEAEVQAHADDGGGEVPAEDNPLAVLLDRGEPLTAQAAAKPDMAELGPDHDDYDAIDEAHQLFHDFEEALRASQPLDPTAWKDALAEHKETNAKVIARAGELRREGHPDEAHDLMTEWSRLYGLYQAQAYGRAPHPVSE